MWSWRLFFCFAKNVQKSQVFVLVRAEKNVKQHPDHEIHWNRYTYYYSSAAPVYHRMKVHNVQPFHILFSYVLSPKPKRENQYDFSRFEEEILLTCTIPRPSWVCQRRWEITQWCLKHLTELVYSPTEAMKALCGSCSVGQVNLLSLMASSKLLTDGCLLLTSADWSWGQHNSQLNDVFLCGAASCCTPVWINVPLAASGIWAPLWGSEILQQVLNKCRLRLWCKAVMVAMISR